MKWVAEGMEVYRWTYENLALESTPVLCVVIVAAGNSARVVDVKDGSERWIDVDYLHTIEETAQLFQDRLAKFI